MPKQQRIYELSSDMRFSGRRAVAVVACMFLLLELAGWAQQTATPAEPGKKEQVIKDIQTLAAKERYLNPDDPDPLQPLPASSKLGLALKESVEWPKFVGSGALAYVYYIQRKNNAFGSSGYGERYAAATADQAIGNIFSDGVFPALLHQDPRHFRRGVGTVRSRLSFALRQTIVVRNDNGEWHFATAKWLGAGTGLGISNLYYRDSRTVSANLVSFAFHIGGDSMINVLEEFWPDIKRRVFHHHQ
jgi:hypothetical protein